MRGLEKGDGTAQFFESQKQAFLETILSNQIHDKRTFLLDENSGKTSRNPWVSHVFPSQSRSSSVLPTTRSVNFFCSHMDLGLFGHGNGNQNENSLGHFGWR